MRGMKGGMIVYQGYHTCDHYQCVVSFIAIPSLFILYKNLLPTTMTKHYLAFIAMRFGWKPIMLGLEFIFRSVSYQIESVIIFVTFTSSCKKGTSISTRETKDILEKEFTYETQSQLCNKYSKIYIIVHKFENLFLYSPFLLFIHVFWSEANINVISSKYMAKIEIYV